MCGRELPGIAAGMTLPYVFECEELGSEECWNSQCMRRCICWCHANVNIPAHAQSLILEVRSPVLASLWQKTLMVTGPLH